MPPIAVPPVLSRAASPVRTVVRPASAGTGNATTPRASVLLTGRDWHQLPLFPPRRDTP